MTVSCDTTRRRPGGSILLVGDATADLATAARALESLADTTVVSHAEAPAALSRLDVDVIIIDSGAAGARTTHDFLAELAAIQPAAVPILLGTFDGTDGPSESAGLVILPRPADPGALQGLCTLALQCAAARRATHELETENNRLRGVEPEPAALAAAA